MAILDSQRGQSCVLASFHALIAPITVHIWAQIKCVVTPILVVDHKVHRRWTKAWAALVKSQASNGQEATHPSAAQRQAKESSSERACLVSHKSVDPFRGMRLIRPQITWI